MSDKLTGKSSSRDNLEIKRQSSSNCNSPSKTNLSIKGDKESSLALYDDFKLDASPALNKNGSNNNEHHNNGHESDGLSSDTSDTSSEASEDEKIK